MILHRHRAPRQSPLVTSTFKLSLLRLFTQNTLDGRTEESIKIMAISQLQAETVKAVSSVAAI